LKQEISSWDQALRLLSRREHSILELRRKMAGRGYIESDIDPLIERLLDADWINEERFTESFVRLRTRTGKGPYRIKRELAERGIDAELIEVALAPYEESWNSIATEVRGRKFGDELPVEYKEEARQKRFLQYRGFTHEQIRAAFTKIAI
jgi:regulatory protein